MRLIAPDTYLIDLEFQGKPRYIGCYVLAHGAGVALVDPGPASTIGALEAGLASAGLALEDVNDLLLTHIHLDHAGATGTLARRNRRLRVHVHRRGAGHMVEPERLLASASRLYGERMETLWGEFLPVPASRVHPLDGGETLAIGARSLQVAYTPGHAAHHVGYFEPATGIAWVGDTLGIRIDNGPWVLPVTPPPDIDMPAWHDSHRRIRAWAPRLLCPTHFGPASPAAEHLDEHEARLASWAERVHADLATDRPDDELAGAFAERVQGEACDALGADGVAHYLAGGGLEDSWRGLARTWRKRATLGACALALSWATWSLHALPSQGGTGVVQGTVRLVGDPLPEPAAVLNTTDPEACGELQDRGDLVVSPDTRGVRNAIVALTGVPELAIPDVQPGHLLVENRGCRFVPHAAVLVTGSMLETINRDPVLHTVHLYGQQEVNLALPLEGMTGSVVLETPGIVAILCDVHGWMRAYVRVDPHPFHAVTDADGRFRITGVPEGSYELEVWHERLGRRSVTVEVGSGVAPEIEIRYSLNDK